MFIQQLESMLPFICLLILDIYGFYQNTSDVVAMKNKRFKKSTTYKFLILGGIVNVFNYLLKIIIMTWLLIDLKEESCYCFAIGLIFTELTSMGLLFGISAIRFFAVLKKKFCISHYQLENVLWKFLFPIFLAIALTLTYTNIFVVGAIQQV